MLRVYFDTCCLNRPLDDRSQSRVVLEAEAVSEILRKWESGEMVLISSEVLMFEVHETKNPSRRAFVRGILGRAEEFVEINESIAARAKEFEGLQARDALHMACAEAASADYLVTCDDRFLSRARTFSGVTVKVVSPRELFDEVFQ